MLLTDSYSTPVSVCRFDMLLNRNGLQGFKENSSWFREEAEIWLLTDLFPCLSTYRIWSGPHVYQLWRRAETKAAFCRWSNIIYFKSEVCLLAADGFRTTCSHWRNELHGGGCIQIADLRYQTNRLNERFHGLQINWVLVYVVGECWPHSGIINTQMYPDFWIISEQRVFNVWIIVSE